MDIFGIVLYSFGAGLVIFFFSYLMQKFKNAKREARTRVLLGFSAAKSKSVVKNKKKVYYIDGPDLFTANNLYVNKVDDTRPKDGLYGNLNTIIEVFDGRIIYRQTI